MRWLGKKAFLRQHHTSAIEGDETKTERYGRTYKHFVWRGVNKAYEEKCTAPKVQLGGFIYPPRSCTAGGARTFQHGDEQKHKAKSR